jgi:hypothetical protein
VFGLCNCWKRILWLFFCTLSINKSSTRLYELNNNILKEVSDNPYLGLQISNDLKWSIHINNVCKKANATLGFLRRNLRNVPENCRKTAYISLVRSTIWNPYLKGGIDKQDELWANAHLWYPCSSANRKQESDGSKNASHDMGYLYKACDQISDFCHQ